MGTADIDLAGAWLYLSVLRTPYYAEMGSLSGKVLAELTPHSGN